jgi:hypothetical protein
MRGESTIFADLTSREAVQRAIDERHSMPAGEFRKYSGGFGKSTKYPLIDKGQKFDSKAIAAVAYAHQFPKRLKLTANSNCRGGKKFGQAAWTLAALGFEIRDLSECESAAIREIARIARLGEQAIRPKQQEFSSEVRRNYANTCAVTGCTTSAALQAAHIRVQNDKDYNSAGNGLLLRADIHLLFDHHLITLSEDSTTVEVSCTLTDCTYSFLKDAPVSKPIYGSPPSPNNIRHHRDRFRKQLPGISDDG